MLSLVVPSRGDFVCHELFFCVQIFDSSFPFLLCPHGFHLFVFADTHRRYRTRT